ncbi:MAG: hypothetical protein HY870_12590, partial [Chloroflexi bacterium]|nr:hypothetical protein [Chloroflexota bacterium]
MNIALLHYSAPPIVGGVENVLAQQARLMQQAGHQVRIIAARGASQPGIEFVPLPLIDSRHPRVLAVKADLDQGRVSADFEPLVDEIERDLRTALIDVDILIAHNVCSLNKNLALTAVIQRIALPHPPAPSPEIKNRFQERGSGLLPSPGDGFIVTGRGAGGEAHPLLILWHHDLAWTTPRYRAELHDGYPWDLL